MRVFFMGTPDIAAHILRKIASVHEVVGVFCQPDKPVGRKAVLTKPPVKAAAEELGIPVSQPVKLKDGSAAEIVRAASPDVTVVVAYGRLLPDDILGIPRFGSVNLHVSLLPRYRGAAPIQHALLNGETETGVSAMYMAHELDAGDIIDARRIAISDEDDAQTLFDRSAEIGAGLILSVLDDIKKGTAKAHPQSADGVSFAPPLTRELAPFTFEDDARGIFNRVRALCIWPCAEFSAFGRRVKVLKAAPGEGSGRPGEVLSLKPLTVAAGGGSVVLLKVKPESSSLMSGTQWAAGKRLKKGDIIEG